MATRSMFLRILWKLLGASRGRLALALVALASGAAVCSALLNVDLDAERKLTQEFRTLGANVVVAPPSGGSDAALADAAVMDRIAALHVPQIVATAPYLYVAANSGTQPVILAGTWFDQVAKMNSWWKIEGAGSLPAMIMRNASWAARPRASLASRPAAPSNCVPATARFHSRLRGSSPRAAPKTARFSRISCRAESCRTYRPREPGPVERIGDARGNRGRHRRSRALPGLEVRPVRQIAAAEERSSPGSED